MSLNVTGAYSWVKKLLIIGFIVLVAGSIGIWYIFTENFTDMSERSAAFSVNAQDLIKEFEKSDSTANARYADNILAVNGIVSEVEAADTTVNIKMASRTSASYIIFEFQRENQADARKLKPGDSVSIKGSCSGGAYSEILESEFITFKRSIVNR